MDNRRIPIRRVLIIALFVHLLLIISTYRAYACDCPEPPPPLEELANDDIVAVFSGKALNTSVQWPFEDFSETVVFDVYEVWKGPVAVRITVYNKPSSCGMDIRKNEEFLVYAYGFVITVNGQPERDLVLDICSRTTSLQYAANDLVELGPGIVPTRETGRSAIEEPLSVTDSGTGRAVFWSSLIALSVCLLVAITLLMRHINNESR